MFTSAEQKSIYMTYMLWLFGMALIVSVDGAPVYKRGKRNGKLKPPDILFIISKIPFSMQSAKHALNIILITQI